MIDGKMFAQMPDVPRPSSLLRPALLLLLTPALALALGCSETEEEPKKFGNPGSGSGTGGEPTPVEQGGPCEDGATKECSVILGEHEGILSCFVGVKVCHDGVWGPCGEEGEGETKSFKWPWSEDGATTMPLALGPPQPCLDNPCDPTCQAYLEDPPDDLKLDQGGSSIDWQTGILSDMPYGLVKKGLNQPCSTASDCQFDHYCSEPTKSTCDHSVCEAGPGLESGCSSCTSLVCASDPSCCESSYGGSCAHDPCVEGGKLKKSCDSCVKKICDADSYCCNNFWDDVCVDQVATVCNKTCNTGGSWDASCVEKVHDVCGSFCGADPAADSGECKPWLPTQTDSECAGADLTAGVPCDGSIPICNRGTVTAPAGIKIVHFPGNSQQYPKVSPSTSHPQKQTCFTAEAIPPGTCIDVTTCPGLSGNREIMVNPVDGSQVAECTHLNNWTLYSGDGSCTAPTCSAVTSEATFKKVNMFVAIDKSGSMATNGWTSAMNALKSFIQDPESEGLGVALRFWPDNSPSTCGSPTCSVNNCSQPLVALNTLTAASGAADPHEQALVSAINSKSPGGGTPMYAALAGATQWGKNYAAANPDEQAVVVLVTDGQPTECGTNVNSIAQLAADAYTQAGVLTYVVGIQLDANTVSTVNQIAAAGGTGQAFLVPKNNVPNGVNAELLAALSAIKGEAVECEFALPNEGQFDPSNVTMIYTPSNGTPEGLNQVSGPQACGSGGWYYDVPANPTKATLCPSTCAEVQSDSGAKVAIEIGCPGAYSQQQFTEVYEGACPPGSQTQWGYFSYKSYTPGDSNVAFRMRTADTAAGLASAAYTAVATAQSSPTNTQVCNVSTGPPCPIDMFLALGGLPKARHRFVELELDLSPTSNGAAAPIVYDWKLTFSCPDSE